MKYINFIAILLLAAYVYSLDLDVISAGFKQIEVDEKGILWWQDTREEVPPQKYWSA
jgi:hypothetical protein